MLRCLLLVGVTLLAGLSALPVRAQTPGFAQGYLVQPMRLEAFVKPGRTVQLPLEVYNFTPGQLRTINLNLVELTQTPQGNWQVVDPGAPQPLPQGSSALPWTTLLTDSVNVPIGELVTTGLEARVPADARGTYFAGLIAQPPVEDPGGSGLLIRSRLLIPVILHIEGRPQRQNIHLDGATLNFGVPPNSSDRETTMATLQITNAGQTFPRIRGQINVERLANDRWRPVTIVNIPERGIIPGATLRLGEDLRRRLPSGQYRLTSTIWVDGRRTSAVEQEIAFEGDPSIDAIAYDTTLSLSPAVVDMAVVPGAARTMVLAVENPSEYPVNVNIAAVTPRALMSSYGDVMGSSFSAETWTDVRPSSFTLRPGGKQNIRVTSAVPRENATQPHYYADIVLSASYEDGQSAGTTLSTIHLANGTVVDTNSGIVDQLQLSEGIDPAHFIVTARFLNVGNTDVTPKISVDVLANGNETVLTSSLSGDPGILLPLGARTFSEELDFSAVAPGEYAMRATAQFATNSAVKELRVSVFDEPVEGVEGAFAKRVTILDGQTDIEAPSDESPGG